MSDGRQMVYGDDPVFVDTIRSENISTATEKWYGAVLGPNGRIYFIPGSETQVLEFNPVSKKGVKIGTVFSTGAKWTGGVLAPNGRIYCMPDSGIITQILEIDPITKTTTLVGAAINGVSFGPPVLGLDGFVYAPPLGANRILKFNPTTKEYIYVGPDLSFISGKKFHTCVLAKNGFIYFAPAENSDRVLAYNPETNVHYFISIQGADNTLTNVIKWTGGDISEDNKIYFAPHTEKKILMVDANNNTAQTIGDHLGDSSGKFYSLSFSPNRKLYCAPGNTNQIIEIDPKTNTTKLIDVGLTGSLKYYGSVLAPNGCIYATPRRTDNVLEINTFPKSTDFQSHLRIPNFI